MSTRRRNVNPTEFAILGLLAGEPLTGYAIKKRVEEQLAHFWSESFGHIYPMLRRLHERGLVEQRVEQQESRPNRRIYSITTAGRRALEDWFATPAAPSRPRNEVLLRIFFGRHADPQHLIRDVRAQREGFQHALAQLRAIRAQLDEEDAAGDDHDETRDDHADRGAEPADRGAEHADREYWELTLSYGLEALEAVAAWGEQAEMALTRMAERSRP